MHITSVTCIQSQNVTSDVGYGAQHVGLHALLIRTDFVGCDDAVCRVMSRTLLDMVVLVMLGVMWTRDVMWPHSEPCKTGIFVLFIYFYILYFWQISKLVLFFFLFFIVEFFANFTF